MKKNILIFVCIVLFVFFLIERHTIFYAFNKTPESIIEYLANDGVGKYDSLKVIKFENQQYGNLQGDVFIELKIKLSNSFLRKIIENKELKCSEKPIENYTKQKIANYTMGLKNSVYYYFYTESESDNRDHTLIIIDLESSLLYYEAIIM